MKIYQVLVLLCIHLSVGFSQESKYKLPESFLDKIIVTTSNFDFKKDAKYEYDNRVDSESWQSFSINNFDSLSPNNPKITYNLFRKRMIDICHKDGLDSLSLSKCLDIIKKDGDSKSSKYVILPVAAYLAKYGRKKIWVILCIWEWEETLKDISYSKTLFAFGHDRGYAINPDNLKIIGFHTCE